MTSPKKSVETVDINWRIPNFRDESGLIFSDGFFVGGRVPPAADSKSNYPPVKLAAVLSKTLSIRGWHWKVSFRVVDGPELPSSCILRGKLLELKTFDGEKFTLIQGKNRSETKRIDFYAIDHFSVPLFDASEVENYVEKGNGSLNVCFKLEVTFSVTNADTTNIFAGGNPELVLNDFESLLKDPTNADVEIKVTLGKGQTFQCHKLILAARSPIFAAMFGSEMKERKKTVVEVDDILPKTMEHFISFIYSGRFQDSSWIQSLPQLAYAAEKYDVKSLRNLCDTHLIQCVSFRNALTLGKLAERYGLKNAAKDIRKFIADYSEAVTLDIDMNETTTTSNANFNITYSYSAPHTSTKTACGRKSSTEPT